MADEQRAVLFADLDGYTALTEAHGDLDAVEVAERFVATAGDLLRGDARLVKTLGDAVLIVASEVADAVDIAVELVEAIDELGPTRLALVPDPVRLDEVIDLSPAPSILDPVCHMRLDPRDATAWLHLDGLWHFCSAGCLRAFLDGPHLYLAP